MKKFLFIAPDNSKDLTFQTVCTDMRCEIQFSKELVEDQFDVIFLPSDVDLMKNLLKMTNKPETIFIYGSHKKTNLKMQKLLLFENLKIRLVIHEFASGQTSSFGSTIKTLL